MVSQGKPILQRENCKHCRALKVLADNIPHLIFLALTLPPPEGIHIVGTCSADRKVWVTGRIPHRATILLWHPLHLQGEYLEIPEHLRHTIGNHPQILSTREHIGR